MNPIAFISIVSFAALIAPAAFTQNFPGDEALSKVLIPGEDWQLIGEGYGFTDAACGDAQGNFYFSDLRKNVLHRVSPDGKVSVFLENGPSISGL